MSERSKLQTLPDYITFTIQARRRASLACQRPADNGIALSRSLPQVSLDKCLDRTEGRLLAVLHAPQPLVLAAPLLLVVRPGLLPGAESGHAVELEFRGCRRAAYLLVLAAPLLLLRVPILLRIRIARVGIRLLVGLLGRAGARVCLRLVRLRAAAWRLGASNLLLLAAEDPLQDGPGVHVGGVGVAVERCVPIFGVRAGVLVPLGLLASSLGWRGLSFGWRWRIGSGLGRAGLRRGRIQRGGRRLRRLLAARLCNSTAVARGAMLQQQAEGGEASVGSVGVPLPGGPLDVA
mmetsp:Transcript_109555/g.288983  ORF Transcript_109555/g.288983 Transcript_109555/m.288983 type:complete len:292 (+) Transcript_109555:181-1056(+)